MFIARCPAANPTHRQCAVLPEHARWSFVFYLIVKANFRVCVISVYWVNILFYGCLPFCMK